MKEKWGKGRNRRERSLSHPLENVLLSSQSKFLACSDDCVMSVAGVRAQSGRWA